MAVATAQEYSKERASLERFKKAKKKKEPWLPLFQLLGEYIHTRRQNFQGEQTSGEFLTREIFDSTAPKANKTMASSLVGLLWPSSGKRFEFRAPRSLPKNSTTIKKYYEQITEFVQDVLDNPKGGLLTAFDEYMIDQGAFGTSGVEPIEDEKVGVIYRSWSIKEMTISEGKNGEVDSIFLELRFEVQRLVKEYGIENLSERVKKLYENNKLDDEIDIIIAIEPRYIRDPEKLNSLNMAFQSLHYEKENCHLMREKGFDEIPIKVGRMTKIIGETYGRSPGMDALPDVLEANIIWEATTIAIEKNLAPPLGVLDDGRLGGEEIDTSANAVNVFNFTGRAGEGNPVFPLFTVGEIKQTVNLLERLAEQISNHFYVDRLLDFNNQTQMTLGEAQMRNRIRFATLNSIFARQIQDVFSPVIERTFNILFKQGKLGVVEGSLEHQIAVALGEDPIIIPGEVAKLMLKGADVYQIKYFTPAMRIMQAEEAEGIMRSWQFAGELKKLGIEQACDPLDEDISVTRFTEISGAPSEIIRAKDAIKAIRDGRAEMLEQQAQLAAAQQGSEVIRNLGQSQPSQKTAA